MIVGSVVTGLWDLDPGCWGGRFDLLVGLRSPGGKRRTRRYLVGGGEREEGRWRGRERERARLQAGSPLWRVSRRVRGLAVMLQMQVQVQVQQGWAGPTTALLGVSKWAGFEGRMCVAALEIGVDMGVLGQKELKKKHTHTHTHTCTHRETNTHTRLGHLPA